ncbi:MAG: hypothetical protein Kow0042_19950 [Calditrichia bacterium]
MTDIMKKRPKKWNESYLRQLSNEELIDLFSVAIADRTILSTGDIDIENPIRNGSPPESHNLLLKEAHKRGISLENLAERIISKALHGNSFISDLLAPTGWKRYEIHAAKMILELLSVNKIKIDFQKFDARITGKITNEIRQIDLLIKTCDPKIIIACEFKNYKNKNLSVNMVEAFATKLRDIGAQLGYMVTSKGFQKGAIKTAKFYNIKLFRLREMDRKKVTCTFSNFKLDELAGEPF